MDKHVTLLAILHIALHALQALVAVVILVALSTVGILTGQPESAAVLTLIASVVSVFLLVLSAPGIIGGIGLLKHKQWARYLLMVVGFFGLVDVPLGTALGIYTFWVLMHDDAVRLFETAS